jgi:hypothetical protein
MAMTHGQGRFSKASAVEEQAPESTLHLHPDLLEKGPCLKKELFVRR